MAGCFRPNPDSVEEFRLLTSNYNAEYGRSAGGIVTVVTKSGTNQLHGTLYEYLRNDALDSRSFFQPSVSMLRQNQFGGNVSRTGEARQAVLLLLVSGAAESAGQFQSAARTPYRRHARRRFLRRRGKPASEGSGCRRQSAVPRRYYPVQPARPGGAGRHEVHRAAEYAGRPRADVEFGLGQQRSVLRQGRLPHQSGASPFGDLFS